MLVDVPKFNPPAGMPPDRARLGGERHGVQDAFFIGDAGHQLRHADAQVDHHARPQLQRRVVVMIVRVSNGSGAKLAAGTLISQLKAGS